MRGFATRLSDIPDPDTGPVDVIETVITTAARPINWPNVVLWAVAAAIAYLALHENKKYSRG